MLGMDGRYVILSEAKERPAHGSDPGTLTRMPKPILRFAQDDRPLPSYPIILQHDARHPPHAVEGAAQPVRPHAPSRARAAHPMGGGTGPAGVPGRPDRPAAL